MSTQTEQLYDVVIVHIETGKVDSIAGKNMPMQSGFHNAQKRLETVSPRLNDDYCCRICKAGLPEEGKVAPAWYDAQP